MKRRVNWYYLHTHSTAYHTTIRKATHRKKCYKNFLSLFSKKQPFRLFYAAKRKTLRSSQRNCGAFVSVLMFFGIFEIFTVASVREHRTAKRTRNADARPDPGEPSGHIAAEEAERSVKRKHRCPAEADKGVFPAPKPPERRVIDGGTGCGRCIFAKKHQHALSNHPKSGKVKHSCDHKNPFLMHAAGRPAFHREYR